MDSAVFSWTTSEGVKVEVSIKKGYADNHFWVDSDEIIARQFIVEIESVLINGSKVENHGIGWLHGKGVVKIDLDTQKNVLFIVPTDVYEKIYERKNQAKKIRRAI